MNSVTGIVVVDKPAGPTSFDVVRRIKGLYRVKRCGHTGTLDPMATGVLPICLGEATKVAGFVADGEKEYAAVVRFGEVTDTQDAAGTTLARKSCDGLTEARIAEALAGFVGLIEQTPPMYSARKIDGKRLYELAREGQEVEREARTIHIEEARVTSFEAGLSHRDGGATAVDAGIFVRCSKGTYLRTIAHDLGEKLGPGAHLKTLRRVRVGPFGLEDAVGLDVLMAIAKERREDILKHVLPLGRALDGLAELHLDDALARRVIHGHSPGPSDLSRLRAPPYARGRKVRLVKPDGEVMAVAESDGVGTLKLMRVFAAAGGSFGPEDP